MSDDKPLADSAPLAHKPRRPRLRSIAQVRAEMRRQYYAHLDGQVATRDFNARINALRTMTESFVAFELEASVSQLEFARKVAVQAGASNQCH